jgi:uncharacterized protein YjbJ (UPF0337 family)
MKGKVKEQWGKLTDDDLDQSAGKRDQLEGKSKSGTASKRTASALMWMTGTADKAGNQR